VSEIELWVTVNDFVRSDLVLKSSGTIVKGSCSVIGLHKKSAREGAQAMAQAPEPEEGEMYK